MNRDSFARDLGFTDFETLLDASEVVAHEKGNDVQWYVTKLPGGDWAAWDDSEIDVDYVAYTGIKIAAIQYVYDCLMASGYDCTGEPLVEKYRVSAERVGKHWAVRAHGHLYAVSCLCTDAEDAIREVLGGGGEHDTTCKCV